MSRTVPLASRLRASRVRCADKSTCSPGLNLEKEFLSPRAREEQITPRCAKRRSPLRSNSRKRHAIRSRRGGRLVQWTAGRRRSRRDSRLIVKTSPRFTVNWPALASSILEDSGPVFTNQSVVGETPSLAAGLQALAGSEAVVIAASTRRLVGDFFEYRDLGAVEV